MLFPGQTKNRTATAETGRPVSNANQNNRHPASRMRVLGAIAKAQRHWNFEL
jgi:hypothetical protein